MENVYATLDILEMKRAVLLVTTARFPIRPGYLRATHAMKEELHIKPDLHHYHNVSIIRLCKDSML
jgi:hypothetical protein